MGVRVTKHLGKDIWKNTIIVLTRAGSLSLCKVFDKTHQHISSVSCQNCPDSTTKKFVVNKLIKVQYAVRCVSGFCVPKIAFVENYNCRKNTNSQMILPDETVWIENFLNSMTQTATDLKPYRWISKQKKKNKYFCRKCMFSIIVNYWYPEVFAQISNTIYNV